MRATQLPLWQRILILVAGIAAADTLSAKTQAQSFTGIGDLAGGAFTSRAFAVSPDGQKVTGFGTVSDTAPESRAFIWTSGSGITELGLLSGSEYWNQGQGITNSGMVAGTGDSDDPDTGRPWAGTVIRWDPNPTELVEPATTWANDGYTAGSNAIDGTGNIIVGYAADTDEMPGDRPTVWVNGVPRHLDFLDFGNGIYTDYAYSGGINTPGTHIAGTSHNFTVGDSMANSQAVLWTDATAQWSSAAAKVPIGLGFLPGISPTTDASKSAASDVSNDGQIIVGSGGNGATNSAVPAGRSGRDAQVGAAILGVPGGVPNAMIALPDIGSNDGTTDLWFASAAAVNGNATTESYTAVGWGYNGLHDAGGEEPNDDFADSTDVSREALLWLDGAVHNIETYATGLGLNLTGWDLQEASAISDDGTVIVGWGYNPLGNEEGWVLTIPTSGTDGDYNDDGNVNAADYVAWRKIPAAFGSAQGYDDWRSQFGELGGSGESAQVPEPLSLVLFLFGCAMTLQSIRRRDSSSRTSELL
jgi:uncharacterized membrane protein